MTGQVKSWWSDKQGGNVEVVSEAVEINQTFFFGTWKEDGSLSILSQFPS